MPEQKNQINVSVQNNVARQQAAHLASLYHAGFSHAPQAAGHYSDGYGMDGVIFMSLSRATPLTAFRIRTGRRT